jgi:hypothetical protein
MPQRASTPATLPPFASVRLLVQRERWLEDGRDVYGYQARVTILKNPFGPTDKVVPIAVLLHDGTQGDAT